MWSRVRAAPSRASSVRSRDRRAGLEIDESKTGPHVGESLVYTGRGRMSVIAGTGAAARVGRWLTRLFPGGEREQGVRNADLLVSLRGTGRSRARGQSVDRIANNHNYFS